MSPAAADSVLTGIGVVIDDCVNASPAGGDLISNLMEQIQEAGIPCVVYDKLPPIDFLKHCSNVAFILLDWELWGQPDAATIEAGTVVGPEIKQQGDDANIEFLNALKSACFAPVFIFSHLSPDVIKGKLNSANLLGADEKRDFILVREKSDLSRPPGQTGCPLMEAVKSWIESNPVIYVLSRWKNAVSSSQNFLFWDFYETDNSWPGVLWRTYGEDGDDPELALADVLFRNMRARMLPLLLDSDLVMPATMPLPNRTNLCAVLETSMIIPHKRLPVTPCGCGDLFQGTRQRYWINIRCDCDCIPRNGQDPDAVILYLLKAKIMNDNKFLYSFDKNKLGLIQNHSGYHVLFPVAGKALQVQFGEFCQVSVGDLNARIGPRIGRLTQPYITQIRQRFALHLQRDALPRIPNEAVPPEDAGA